MNPAEWKNPEGEPNPLIVRDLTEAMKQIEKDSRSQPDETTVTETHIRESTSLETLIYSPQGRSAVVRGFVAEYRNGGFPSVEKMLLGLSLHLLSENRGLVGNLVFQQNETPKPVLVFNYPKDDPLAMQQAIANAEKIRGYQAIVTPRDPNKDWSAVECIQPTPVLPGFKKVVEMTEDHRVRIIYEEEKSGG